MPDHEHGKTEYRDDDDKKLEALGYVPSFKREFSNLATVCTPLHTHCRVFMGGKFLSLRSALLSALWYALSFAALRMLPTDIGAQGLCSSVATTFNTPLLLGGPSSVRQHAWHISVCDLIKNFSIGHMVLDSRSDHVFHIRQVLSAAFLFHGFNAMM